MPPSVQFAGIVYDDKVIGVAPSVEYVGNLWLLVLVVGNGPRADTANVKHHSAHHEKTLRHPQNRKYITYTILVRGPNHDQYNYYHYHYYYYIRLTAFFPGQPG